MKIKTETNYTITFNDEEFDKLKQLVRLVGSSKFAPDGFDLKLWKSIKIDANVFSSKFHNIK